MKTTLCHININFLKAAAFISLIVFVSFGNGYAGISAPVNWQQIHTENTILYFQNMDDLNRFNTRINYNPNNDNSDSRLAVTISKKIDALFRKSQDLLEMKGFTNKINVKIFSNRQQLNHAFYALYKKECNARAWYAHEKLTIYIQLDDLYEGMLAHEFAHAIIDHYMIIPPPGKAAEILARYVDTHLQMEAIKNSSESQIKAYSTK
ncbi:MAG: hypothetical protein KKE44_11000 [Proteobacteria bacterium]|nr:hypothetical protein [Pseudomonadota bacterium]MBU1583249.1 hypothetical protein [Pseudomonadota bacterium]MBU2455454.1 hypothetical protein [Pseudomonadota bacterium]MBU2629355.1 hypothetical protein [Pseudomonadota bacterium]